MGISVYTPPNSKIVHYTYADFVSRQLGRPVHIVQYDDSLPILAVRLYQDGQSYALPSNVNVNIRLKKPDGNFVYNTSLGCDAGRQTVYFEVTPQMAVLAGEESPVVEIDNNGSVAASSPIGIVIDLNPVQNDEIESTGEYKSVARYAAEAVDAASSAFASRSAAKISETNAKASENKATNMAGLAENHKNAAESSAYNAKVSETNAKTSETNAKASEQNAKSYADSWKGSLLPKGFITFSQLPVSGNVAGHMYHITHAFVTDARFRDGAGYSYPAGTNVYWTSDGKWDCLSGNITKEITQVEYNALSESEKMNGTIYYISDSDNLIGEASDTVAGLVIVDKVLSSASENPVQNKVVKGAIDQKANLASPSFTGTPTAPTASGDTNNAQIATTAFVKAVVNALINGAPETLDTLKELADAVTANKTLADALNAAIGNKVDKVAGKGLSANDYTTAEKEKLGGVAANANNYSLPEATSSVRGGVKTGYTLNGKNYPVQLSNEQMYVNVPWTDTNTWRGIQNSLTSDSTSDSLSAAQGKALANGSARDGTKLPLSGGTISGALTVTGATTLSGSVYVKGVEAARFKKVTQSEYNALPSTKTSDNVIYFITD